MRLCVSFSPAQCLHPAQPPPPEWQPEHELEVADDERNVLPDLNANMLSTLFVCEPLHFGQGTTSELDMTSSSNSCWQSLQMNS